MCKYDNHIFAPPKGSINRYMHKIFFRLREYALSDYYVLSMGALKLIGTLSLGSIDETYEMIEGGIYEMI